MSVAKIIGTMHSSVTELAHQTKNLMLVRDRIDTMEKTLISHGRLLNDIVECVRRQESLLTDMNTLKLKTKSDEPVKIVMTDADIREVARMDAEIEANTETHAETHAEIEANAETHATAKDTTQPIMLSEPVVKELASVNANANATMAALAASNVETSDVEDTHTDMHNDVHNDDVEISESDEETVKPKPKAAPAKKKLPAKRNTRK